MTRARADGAAQSRSRAGRENSRLDGYDAWLQRSGQAGSIIVRVDTRCTLREIYARDGARLDR